MFRHSTSIHVTPLGRSEPEPTFAKASAIDDKYIRSTCLAKTAQVDKIRYLKKQLWSSYTVPEHLDRPSRPERASGHLGHENHRAESLYQDPFPNKDVTSRRVLYLPRINNGGRAHGIETDERCALCVFTSLVFSDDRSPSSETMLTVDQQE
jgi:hypothetical protein